ncbi:hypothetical protein C3K47_05170 [Solitalea longa]|uniref:Peptidase S9 prolyl oligopeptidase catalytic domain-containing protein n=1 Tax=Solitalea longa TaxID=2079460 RepID=A0A2S5A6H7_9SPHI|nr:prolyl oligopeptidase family serine peptidase [Solitalea longa]POY37919.1 hypothetical protein C3K47_05170 [Solitalea longa]
MKKINLTVLLFFCISYCFAQKPAVDFNVLDSWTSVHNAKISNDGKYAVYNSMSSPYHDSPDDRLVIKQLNGQWEKIVQTRSAAEFSSDSKTAIFIFRDSLCLVQLGSAVKESIPNILGGYKIFSVDNQSYLAVRRTTADKALLIRNLTTGKEQTYTGIIDFMVSPSGNHLLLRVAGDKDSGGQDQLSLVDLRTGKQSAIFKGFGPTNYVFNKKEDQLAFAVLERVGNGIGRTIYTYSMAENKATKIMNNQSAGVDTSMAIEQIDRFSNDNTRLFFTVKRKPATALPATGVKVDVWSYTDVKLQSLQQYEETPPDVYMVTLKYVPLRAVVNLSTKKIIQLEQEGDKMMPVKGEKGDDFIFLSTQNGMGDEAHWNKGAGKKHYMVNTRTGQRTFVDLALDTFHGISPSGKYIIARDKDQQNCFIIELATGKTVNLTDKVAPLKPDEDYDNVAPQPGQFGDVAAWIGNDEAVLLYDKCDIWKFDVTGKREPVNLTNGYGRRNRIVFRFAEDQTLNLNEKGIYLLCAFNLDNKDNGYYNLKLNKTEDPTLLTMGPYLYNWGYLTNSPLLKARDANVWIATRQSAAESRNFFITTDFKTYTPLSNAYPEKDYNWLTSEIMSWKDEHGEAMQGILYKPENFHPAKKYPIIFDYYEKRSHEKNFYHAPALANDRINIPWFVSHGYLVYTPDINYTVGEPGKSALKAVTGAAKMLSVYPWVDTTKMGIQGHSFGGYETHYIVTHTNMFAAAMAAAGVSDLISGYNYLWYGGNANQDHEEVGQGRMGGTLWNKQAAFIENTSVLNADKVTSPLLMMHNKGDGAVPFTQSLEMFLSLRRLGKRAWLLQYDNQTHGVLGEAAKDYTIRMDQFFDHYLKGAPAPKWMLEGVPAVKKGIENGLELSAEKDANGKPVTPGPGLLKLITLTTKN